MTDQPDILTPPHVGQIVCSECFDVVAEKFSAILPRRTCARCGRECLGYQISELQPDVAGPAPALSGQPDAFETLTRSMELEAVLVERAELQRQVAMSCGCTEAAQVITDLLASRAEWIARFNKLPEIVERAEERGKLKGPAPVVPTRLVKKWSNNEVVAPEPPPCSGLLEISPTKARCDWWREGYAAAVRDCAEELRAALQPAGVPQTTDENRNLESATQSQSSESWTSAMVEHAIEGNREVPVLGVCGSVDSQPAGVPAHDPTTAEVVEAASAVPATGLNAVPADGELRLSEVASGPDTIAGDHEAKESQPRSTLQAEATQTPLQRAKSGSMVFNVPEVDRGREVVVSEPDAAPCEPCSRCLHEVCICGDWRDEPTTSSPDAAQLQQIRTMDGGRLIPSTPEQLARDLRMVAGARSDTEAAFLGLAATALDAQALVLHATRKDRNGWFDYAQKWQALALGSSEAHQATKSELRTARDHSQCHDLVCNCDTKQYPRGAKGVGCSCAGRDAAYAERIKIALRAEQWEAELRTVQQERQEWFRAALFKIRTWDMIQSRHRAGENAEALATDYGVPVQWVMFVLLPENDLNARYARPSDRTATAKADLLEAEAALIALRVDYEKLARTGPAAPPVNAEAIGREKG